MLGITLCSLNLKTDLNSIYQYMMSEEQFLFSTSLVFNTENDFAEWLNKCVSSIFHDFFVIKLKGKIIGFLYNYDFSLKDGHCKIVSFVQKEYRNSGYGVIASIMFMKKLFLSYPIKKIYTDVYEYNEYSISITKKAGFLEEGCLKQFRYHNGKYYSLYILAMEKRQFLKKYGRRIKC